MLASVAGWRCGTAVRQRGLRGLPLSISCTNRRGRPRTASRARGSEQVRTTPTPITSIEELHSKLKSLMPEGERVCIGIDGMDGVGKSHLARKLGGLLGAKVISLDHYLNRK